ncbi:Uncharacterized protein FKW44_009386, partial [Caligus rogercresseyi]
YSKAKKYSRGFYDCRPQGPLDSSLGEEYSFHLSVKDDRRPYALGDRMTYTSAEEGSNAYVPCRPTHSGIRVRVERRENPGFSLSELDYNFQKGFLLLNVSIEEDAGVYRCILQVHGSGTLIETYV